MALFFGHALPYMAAHNNGNLYADLVPADERVEAVSGTQELAGGCLDGRVVNLRSQVLEQLNTNLLFNSSMAGATGSVLPTNWASGSVSGLTYTISSASTVQGLRSIEWTVSGTALSDGDLWLACEPMVSGSVVAQIPSEYVGSMYCAKVSGTINAGMVLQTLTQNFINGAVQETKTKDLAAVTGQTFVRIEPNSVKTDVDLENRVNLRLYQSIASGEVIDFTIRVAAPQVEAGVTASPFISTVSGAVSEVRGRPSILVVPQLTKAGTVYPQLPTVSGADFTFTRATTATRVNASGLIESVASGLLRLDYPVTGGCPAALIEPSATNLLLRSEAFNVSGTWALVSSGTGSLPVVSANAVISPDGTQNAETVVFNRGAGNAAADQSLLKQDITIPTSVTYTFSVYAKASAAGDVGKQIFIRLGGAGALTAITLTANWTRYSQSEASVASGSQLVQIGNRGTFTADNSVSVDLWGAQLEAGSIATTYIPTTTTTASRAADVISASGALVSGLIGQTEGTMYFQIRDLKGLVTGTGNPALAIRNTAFTNWIGLTSNSVSTPFRIQVRSTTTTLINYISAITEGKVAIAYSANGAVVYVNGSEVASSATNPNLTLNIVTMEQYMPFKVESLALYTTRLSNDQLAELTRL